MMGQEACSADLGYPVQHCFEGKAPGVRALALGALDLDVRRAEQGIHTGQIALFRKVESG
jgi:hypothetical protein